MHVVRGLRYHEDNLEYRHYREHVGRRARWTLAVFAAALLVLTSPAIEAQGQRTVEGTLEIYAEDSYQGPRLNHVLNTGTERVKLQLGKKSKHLMSGSRIKARGAMKNGTLMLDPEAGGSGSSVETMALASAYTFGPQPTLVILFNFQDLATQPYTPATAQSVTFTEANNFYVENSYGQTSLEGVVVGWYTIAASRTVCNYNNWATLAETAAANAGVNLAAFPRRVYGFPQTSACSWWGLGTIGGGTAFFPSRAWINGSYSLQVVAHELGHNFGAYHSRSKACESSGCTTYEYGDDHDIMGAAASGHFNAFQKERLGWLGYGSSPSIQTVSATGEYTLEPYVGSTSGFPKALRVLQSSNAGTNTYIYAEMRTQTGFDSALAPGVVIHTGVDTNGAEGYEVDLQPSVPIVDFLLSPGESITFDDTITITTLSSGSFGAVIGVTNLSASAPTTLVPAAATGPYGGTTTLSAALSASGAPVEGRSIAFSVNGTPVGSDTTDASGVATLSNVSLTGLTATVYPVGVGATFDGDENYDVSSGTSSLTVTPKPVDPLVTAAGRPYDGTLSAAASCTLSGVLAGDSGTVGCTVGGTGTASFASAAVGSHTVTVTGLELTGGAAAGNYTLTSTTATTTAAITALTVTPAVTAAAKPYDGTPSATASCTLSGVLAGDLVACTGTASFDTPNQGTGKTVTVSNLALSGAAAGNYTLSTTTATTTANIISPLPGLALLVSPSGSIATRTPTITWSAVPLATYYFLSITDGSAGPAEVWYTPAQANCASGAGACTVAAPRALLPGLVSWKVLTWNPYGYGQWSSAMSAIVDLADASTLAPMPSGPSGAIATRTPSYMWAPVAGAVWYQLAVTDALGSVRQFWYRALEACPAASCSATPNLLLPIGPSQWQVRAWTPAGSGAWSAPRAFETADSAPGKALVVSPTAAVTSATPNFTWNAVIGTSYYLLRVVDRDDAISDRWYRPSDAGCPLGSGTCSVSPGTSIKAGPAMWGVLTWNGSGYGPWSDPAEFSVEIADPSALTPTPLSPTVSISSPNATYRWTGVAGVTFYRLSVRNNGVPASYWWFTPEDAGCAAAAECSATPPVSLQNGTAEWQMQAWTANGHGNWSTPVSLTVTIPAPLAPGPVFPSGSVSASPTLVWNASAGATLYYIRAYDSTGLRVDRWLTPAQAGCPSGTGVCIVDAGVTLNSGAGSWQLLAWNPTGYSPWSSTLSFVVR